MPKLEKLAAQAAADSAYQHSITTAKSVIEVLATGRPAPSRTSSHSALNTSTQEAPDW